MSTHVPCPLCGRADGKHDPTPADAAQMRHARRRAFWHGFLRGLRFDFRRLS